MKKYKHKKTGEQASYKDGILKSAGFCVEIGVEPSNEFWEEIIEKEYEILSFIDNSKVRLEPDFFIFKKGVDDFFTSRLNIKSTEEELLNNVNYKIYSIKRLSDNTIFTIGDQIRSKNNYSNWNNCVITEIKIKNNKYFITIKKNFAFFSYYLDNDFIKPLPILITKDGKEMYKGDVYYYTDIKVNSRSQVEETKAVDQIPLVKNYIRFSTKEKCQEYIDNNRKIQYLNNVKRGLLELQQDFLNQIERIENDLINLNARN